MAAYGEHPRRNYLFVRLFTVLLNFDVFVIKDLLKAEGEEDYPCQSDQCAHLEGVDGIRNGGVQPVGSSEQHFRLA